MIVIENPNKSEWFNLLKRPTSTVEDIETTVTEIFKDIQQQGDSAVLKYTDIFDGVKLNNMLVTSEEIETAKRQIKPELKEAILLAKQNITRFHEVHIQKIGLYIPGGTAPLFSTVLMLAIPAKIAGCEEIILCSPPNKSGKIADEILFAANLCGVTKVYKIGGIQAIAAMTFGTETVQPVYKIFGPGNQFVTVAKQLATKFGVAIDMPAGPSELLVIADDSAVPKYVAADLLSQAEHGADSQVILVSTSKKLIDAVLKEVSMQLAQLPRRDMAEKAIHNSKAIVVSTNQEALNFINAYAPEHFIICTENETFFTEGIQNAGSVFIGNYTPESAGDYASGTNHTLPTNGFSKSYSGVNLDSFSKAITFQKITKEGIQNIGKAIEVMAEAEGLQAHKNAVSLRLKDLQS